MHFLLLMVRVLLNVFVPGSRDSLTLAARADGRIEHLPIRPRWWDRWLNRNRRSGASHDPRALEVRAAGVLRRILGSGSAD
jgi:hypothetical protein